MTSLVRPVRVVSGSVLAVCVAFLSSCSLIDQLTQPGDLAINRFSALPQEVGAGEMVTLTWDVEGADRVSIDGGVGEVDRNGSVQVRPSATTTFHLLATSETEEARASVEVRVKGTQAVPDTPSPTPTPTPPPTPTPTPSASPTPAPTPSPSPTPTATPTPTPASCGVPAVSVGGCEVTVSRLRAQASGECLELNWAAFDQPCPVALNTVRSLRFDVTAHTALANLRWRRSSLSSDVLTPADGALTSQGTTTVKLSDIVLASSLTLEVVSGDKVLLRFTLRHQ